jgi:hypothetical protein
MIHRFQGFHKEQGLKKRTDERCLGSVLRHGARRDVGLPIGHVIIADFGVATHHSQTAQGTTDFFFFLLPPGDFSVCSDSFLYSCLLCLCTNAAMHWPL